MADIQIISPDMGLNSLVPANALSPKEAAKGSENFAYDYGILKTPQGFAKLDLAAGVDGTNPVLSVFQWTEIDGESHLMAVTTESILDHDRVNNEWDDKTQSGVTMSSDTVNPVSWAEVGHDDTAIYIDDDNTKTKAYHHVIVCDGGLSNIQRWAGRWEVDFGDLVGGGGYHDGTQHRALQVSLSKKNRLLLLSAKEYSNATKTWIDNNQRVRWPTIGKIETWTGTGSGFADLLDTGGTNVWSAPLGSDHIIYQTKGIWSINYIGGTTVFSPIPVIPDLGLFSYHLLTNYNNVHYFLGTDYNVHAYYGGSVRESIGDKIHKYLQDDLDPAYKYKCWMHMGPEGKYLWVLIVPSGATSITKAYRMNMQTKAWMVRDYSSKFTSGGITAVTLAGATSYIIGDTYATALNTLSGYDVSDAGDATARYGDYLLDTSRTLTKDYTAGTWGAGGVDYSKAAEAFTADITNNDILVVFDGSDATNTRYGTHFYTVYDVSLNGFAVYETEDAATNQWHAIADTSTNVPADLSVDSNDTIGFYSACSEDLPGATYNQALDSIQVSDRMVIADADGYIYKVDATYADDDGSNIVQRHLTPVIDAGSPGKFKRWPGARVTAQGDAMTISYRTSDFDTSDTGWTDYTQTLTSEYINYEFFINDSAKKIQWMVSDFSGGQIDLSDLVLMEPVILDNR